MVIFSSLVRAVMFPEEILSALSSAENFFIPEEMLSSSSSTEHSIIPEETPNSSS
jgi:hypothetical protein